MRGGGGGSLLLRFVLWYLAGGVGVAVGEPMKGVVSLLRQHTVKFLNWNRLTHI